MRTMSSSRRRTASGERRGNQRPTAGFWRPAWREGSREGSGPGSPYSPARSNVRAVRAPRTGPHLDHRPPALWLARSRTTALLGPYEVSPDHPDGVVAACQQQAPPDAPTVKGPFLLRRKRPGGGVIGFPAAPSVATSGGIPAVHSRSGPRLCLRPLQTPGHPDALAIGYSNFNGQSSGRTLTS